MIPIDSSLAPELVEFWAKKYKETKEELDGLRETLVPCKSSERDEILDAVRSIKSAVNDEANLRQKLEAAIKEKEELASRLARLEAEQSQLSRQTQLSVMQTSSLAKEATEQRHLVIRQRFPPVHFAEGSEQATVMFTDYKTIIGHLSSQFSQDRLQFIVCPPASLPLFVPACGQHGFWFYAPSNGPFQLIAEMRPNEWSYLGQYVSAPLANAEMKLSEWISLDEETKMAHCSRVAAAEPHEDRLLIRRRYDTGESKITCCSLQCVGYNKVLREALRIAAQKLRLQPVLQEQQTPVPNAMPRKRTRAKQSQEAADASKERAKKKKSSCGGTLVQNKSLSQKVRLSPKVILKLEP
ncbi:hypothetical protein EDD16DRAFT_1567658 [Pisolithus croceorrhizus]|nr:hypothetical protein EDD16DRAFT_1567658 [Pisolithus croceorrhizus]